MKPIRPWHREYWDDPFSQVGFAVACIGVVVVLALVVVLVWTEM